MSLSTWHTIPIEERSIAIFGDSTTEGNVNISNGGIGEQLRLLMQTRWSIGSGGLHGVWRNDWSFTSGGNAWTSATNTDEWDIGPLGPGIFSGTAVQMANGSSKTATWTKPSGLTVSRFKIYVVDASGSGNFSYSLDGGSNWTNVSRTWSQDNSLASITVSRSISSSLIIRAANASGSGVNTYLVGIEPLTNTTGVTVHNIGANGEMIFTSVRPTAVGQWDTWLNQVQPDLVILERYTNDVLFWNTGGDNSSFLNLYQLMIDTVKDYGGEVLLFCFFEQNERDVTAQAEMRAQHHQLAADNNLPIVDMYEILPGGFATADAAGYMSDDLHPSDAGAVFIAGHIWKVIAKSGKGAKVRVSA